ncbi:hypothetical protein ACFE04_029224 [Oxalis oulophora]
MEGRREKSLVLICLILSLFVRESIGRDRGNPWDVCSALCESVCYHWGPWLALCYWPCMHICLPNWHITNNNNEEEEEETTKCALHCITSATITNDHAKAFDKAKKCALDCENKSLAPSNDLF